MKARTITFQGITDAGCVEEHPDERPNRVLVLSSGNTFQILESQGPAFVEDVGPESFEEIPPIGLHVFDGNWVCFCSPDDYALVGTWRPATPEEVDAHLRGEYVWDLPAYVDEVEAEVP